MLENACVGSYILSKLARKGKDCLKNINLCHFPQADVFRCSVYNKPGVKFMHISKQNTTQKK